MGQTTCIHYIYFSHDLVMAIQILSIIKMHFLISVLHPHPVVKAIVAVKYQYIIWNMSTNRLRG
jgi:hypothetical protein